MDFTSLYCNIDDFIKSISHREFAAAIDHDKKRRGTHPFLSLSEIMTIVVFYHASKFKHFKAYYQFLLVNHRHDFPRLVSYNRFVELMSQALIPLCYYLESRKGKVTGISYIDSTMLAVCKNIRISRNKVFKGIAARGKSTMGWSYGFKLHLVVNEHGELLAFKITKANTDDRHPVLGLCKNIFGKLFGDRGYISAKLLAALFEKNIQIITGIKKNMKNRLMNMMDKILLRKRFIIETINDQLKNISDIEHSRHRSPMNFLVNLISGLIAYTHQPKKPSIKGGNGPLSLAY